METSVVIILIGLFIFMGHFLSGVFDRRGIPDVLGLMLAGLLLGPVFQVVDPSSFGKFGSLFSNLVLVFILFESGTGLKISEVRGSFRTSAGITTLGFVMTSITIFVMCKLIFPLPTLDCLFIGTALGGTSSAVVAGLVRKIDIRPKTATILIMESAETDVFTLAVPLSILAVMFTGEIAASAVISQLISSTVLALLIGIGGAFIWSYIISKIPTLKNTKFSTPAFLLLLYGMAEYLKFSGPLTALSFGIAVGNLQYLEPKILERIVPNQKIMLPKSEQDFFGEMVFLLRTFFFVFIGISIEVSRMDWMLWGALITAAVYATRIVCVRILIEKDAPLLDKATLSIMIPKGLGAAVMATLPLQQGVVGGEMIQALCFSIILFSTLYCVLFFFLLKTGVSLPFYALFFGKDKVAEVK